MSEKQQWSPGMVWPPPHRLKRTDPPPTKKPELGGVGMEAFKLGDPSDVVEDDTKKTLNLQPA